MNQVNQKTNSIRKRVSDGISKRISKKGKVRALLLVGCALAVIGGLAVSFIVSDWQNVLAATYGWVQSGWSGGATSTAASHLSNQTGWTYYSSKDTAVSAASTITLALATTTWTTTSENDFKTTGYSASSTLNMNMGSGAATSSAQGSISLFICGNSTYGKANDVEGNIYNSVLIGNQCWMKENMRTTKYPNGSNITKGCATATGCTSWGTDQAWYSCPPNTGNSAEDCAAASTLGHMYQWSAAMNGTTTAGAQGICPTGWHIPTDAQQDTLERYYWTAGGSVGSCNASRSALWECDPAGTQLKSTATGMFSGLLAGYRNTDGSFYYRGTYAYFWSSTQSSANAWTRLLNSTSATVNRYAYTMASGFSVRCLKD